MKKFILSAFATVEFGSMAIAGEKAVVAEAVCNCKPAARVVTLKPVAVKVVKVETVKAYVAEECCAAGARRVTRLRDRRADRRAPVMVVAEAPCCDKAAAAKK